MTKYAIQSLDKEAGVALADGWTPHNVAFMASVCDLSDCYQFDTMTEAQLVLFVLESEVPKLTRGMNYIVVPMHVTPAQLFFPL